MKLFTIAFAISSFIVTSSAYAGNDISKVEREKAAKAVEQVFGKAISPDAVQASSMPGIYQVRGA